MTPLGPVDNPVDNPPSTDLAHLAPTSPITAPNLGELTTSPILPSPTEDGRGQSGHLGDVDLAHELGQTLGLCHYHRSIVASREKHLGIAAPLVDADALVALATAFAASCCKTYDRRQHSHPIPRERPLT